MHHGNEGEEPGSASGRGRGRLASAPETDPLSTAMFSGSVWNVVSFALACRGLSDEEANSQQPHPPSTSLRQWGKRGKIHNHLNLPGNSLAHWPELMRIDCFRQSTKKPFCGNLLFSACPRFWFSHRWRRNKCARGIWTPRILYFCSLRKRICVGGVPTSTLPELYTTLKCREIQPRLKTLKLICV